MKTCDNCMHQRHYTTKMDEYPALTTRFYCRKGHWEDIPEPEPDEIDYWVNCKNFKKKKIFVLIVSKIFPKTHRRAGEQTFFPDKINETFFPVSENEILGKKIHTIRANYNLWEQRAKEINEGNAILSLRYWNGKPYKSKQIEICTLEKIGIQKLEFAYGNDCIDNDEEYETIDYPFIDEFNSIKRLNIKELAKNDGLSFEDFSEWFKNYDLSKPMAIIHFTDFRY